eukprot:TRINITY_DN51706_c0_g1_i1.p2 TRINITY_DN51706_c0_g1~~TRINITY_DN51706_c0_g1_i1.p2  ORF type:complete len:138 (+),score=18.98 TRINITY_DN51706_c0_g1_i1:263-676(+)
MWWLRRWRRLTADLRLRKSDQRSERLERVAVNILIVDQDVETIFDLGQQASDRHGIQFRQRTEQRRVRIEGVDPILRQAEHVAQQGPHHAVYIECPVDRLGILRLHNGGLTSGSSANLQARKWPSAPPAANWTGNAD